MEGGGGARSGGGFGAWGMEAAPLRELASRSTGEGAARAGEDDRAATVPRRVGRTYDGARFGARAGRRRGFWGAPGVRATSVRGGCVGKARGGAWTEAQQREGAGRRWRRGARARTARDVATRRDVGLPGFRLALFKHVFLPKIE
jgi:hypothetical protein